MLSRRFIKVLMVTALLLAVACAIGGEVSTVSADCEEELAQVEEELVQVKEERDQYAQRLEDQTMVLIVVMFLLVGSYFFFYLSARRQRVYIIEVEKRLGVEIIPKRQPRRRRRG